MTIQADVMLITVNKYESDAVFRVFERATGEKSIPVQIDNRVYRNLGIVNGARVFHALSEMGATGPGATQQTVDKGIRALKPKAVIAVGIAFGINEGKQAIGDILLSKQLFLYDLQRVSSNRIIPRGDKPHASAWLINLFAGVAQSTWEGANVKLGVMLSGEKLIDNVDYRAQLLEFEPEAIGGEMEGAGLYVASDEHKVDWIVIKAICDWADGNKSTNKEARQKRAANNAAEFVLHAFQQVRFAKAHIPKTIDPTSSHLPAKTSNPRKPSAKSILERQASYSNIKSLIAHLLPTYLQEKFEYSEWIALTNDDEAGLALIAELIDKKAENTICVMGRGPQLVDPQTSHYVGTVASAILRGVEYKRILLLDSNLPQNGLLWLLLIERFLKSAKWRDSVYLYVIRMDSTNLALQFQLIDDKYLHQVARSYLPGEAGASQKAQSQFTISPHGEVAQHYNIFQTRLSQAGNRYEHSHVVELLSKILHDLEAKQQNITYHWKLVLEVIGFLEHLNVQENMPSRGIKFVGSLMPCTFTYQAAEKFIKSVNESDSVRSECLIVLPFRRLEDAIKQFIERRLDYVCVPIENSHIDNLIPPTVSESLFDLLQKDFHKIYEVDLAVKFVLSGMYQKPIKWRELVAVEAAYLQIRDGLPQNARRLPRYEGEVESNYHAAWLAQNDVTLIAVTTYEAARHLNLCTYANLHPSSGKNNTKFAVYSHSAL